MNEPEGSAEAPRPGVRLRGLIVTVAAVAVVAGLLGGVAGAWLQERSAATLSPLTAADSRLPVATGSAPRPAGSIAAIARRVLPSVVAIKVTVGSLGGTGSGFVLRADGYLLTNNHVVADAGGGGSIKVVFDDGSTAPAVIVGRDPSYDLAVLKIGRTGLTPLALGDSDAVVVGDPVIAVGAPLGLQSTVTSGIVSALNRPVSPGGGPDEQSFINAIQTDAAINPGNSGGPLLDAGGTVIGINSAIAAAPGSADSAGSIGLGFAIPSKQARRTAEQLIATGKATHPVIGVMLDQQYDGEGVKVLEQSPDGTPTVSPGGPASRAGVRPGDVIVAFNGRPVADPDTLVVAIRAQAPGDTVRLTIRRGGAQLVVSVTLDAAGD